MALATFCSHISNNQTEMLSIPGNTTARGRHEIHKTHKNPVFSAPLPPQLLSGGWHAWGQLCTKMPPLQLGASLCPSRPAPADSGGEDAGRMQRVMLPCMSWRMETPSATQSAVFIFQPVPQSANWYAIICTTLSYTLLPYCYLTWCSSAVPCQITLIFPHLFQRIIICLQSLPIR